MIAHVCLRHKIVDLCAMAPDLLRWGNDLISVSADYNDESFEQESTRESESYDARTRATPKDKFNSSIVADKGYLCDFKIIPPHLQVSATNNKHGKSYKFTIYLLNKNMHRCIYRCRCRYCCWR